MNRFGLSSQVSCLLNRKLAINMTLTGAHLLLLGCEFCLLVACLRIHCFSYLISSFIFGKIQAKDSNSPILPHWTLACQRKTHCPLLRFGLQSVRNASGTSALLLLVCYTSSSYVKCWGAAGGFAEGGQAFLESVAGGYRRAYCSYLSSGILQTALFLTTKQKVKDSSVI